MFGAEPFSPGQDGKRTEHKNPDDHVDGVHPGQGEVETEEYLGARRVAA